ncbi:MAG TPA: phosphatidate cytidylyltransferase [Gemmatirosa sp.]
MSELSRRVASAVVAVPVTLACVWFGDAALATLLAAAAAVGAWEFYRMADAASGARSLSRTGIVLAALAPLVVHASARGFGQPPITAAVLVVLGLLAAAVWRRGAGGHPLVAVATTVLGVAYVGVPLAYGYALRTYDYVVGRAAGAALVLLPLLCTWASDIGAYASGRLIGGPKLIPSVSPGKTVSGAIGALVASGALAAVYTPFVLRPVANLGFAPGRALLFGLLVSIAAQLGDLVESLLKRDAGVKDSSHLIPGHGGVLDRVDSLLFVLPASYLLLGWLLLPAFGG